MSDRKDAPVPATKTKLTTAFQKKTRPAPPVDSPQFEVASAQQPVPQEPEQLARPQVELGPQNVPVYLPQDLLARLKRERIRQASTYTDILVDAFDTVPTEDLRAAFGMVMPSDDTSAMPRRPRRRRTGGGVQIQLRLDTQQLAWLDRQQQQLQAPSRSALVSTVLGLAIPQD